MKLSSLLLCLLIFSVAFGQVPELVLENEVFFDGVYHGGVDTTGTSDVWGWTSSDGEEYVLAGVKDGTAIIRASDMQHLFTVPGPTFGDYYYHRDIKTYRHYAYVSAEMTGTNEGVQVIDLSGLPDTVVYLKSRTDRITTSHNLSIDTLNARAYVTGSTFEGVYIYDLFDPENPLAVAYLAESGVHDVFARNDTAWIANGVDYSIWYMIDPADPILITRLTDTTFGYCHNIWPTKDGRHFVTTEETADKTVKIWSLDAQGNTALVSEFLAPCKLAHNAHVEGDYLFLSHYTSGVYVVDLHDPANPVAVAQYDTYPLNDTSEFYGCWGVYPHSPSGYIYASSFEGKVQKFRFAQPTGISPERTEIPVLLFPNPGTSPALGFSLGQKSKVILRWLDAQGRELSAQQYELGAGAHRLEAEATVWPSGRYFYQLETAEGKAAGTWLKAAQ
ncbi:MAG: choice-of-anchor B family protein [Bacteroidia bacterium]